ncbi:hypothetical protein QTO30_01855 [Yoonia sp. GPGPB17]|uniref:imm11 family protein n=1 Tax=Yoonia sp. GPGPB17 TaxID=3026147 RepID=UPI0030C3A122
MTWIFKATTDGRGGFVELYAVDPDNLSDWSRALPLRGVGVSLAGVYKGKDAELLLKYVPRHFVTPKRINAFKDLFWVEGKMLVISERFREIIKAHDPGIHHIWPIQVMSKKGVAYPDALYGFVPAVHAAAISETEGDVHITEPSTAPPTKLFPQGVHTRRSTRLRPSWIAAVHPDKVPSQNIWWDHGLTRNYLLLSDVLHDAIVAADLKVIPMKKTTVARCLRS